MKIYRRNCEFRKLGIHFLAGEVRFRAQYDKIKHAYGGVVDRASALISLRNADQSICT